ncbi:kelch-like protein 20 [Caerostris extrusa]|uniref:Kelch-like protein 20 n=1 Tax=Caerostris extrusa TaxID=172846 RepID=A0AAV4VF18_CAEEX|nr:kelch-like protein 20 [Caerostris extrusa]
MLKREETVFEAVLLWLNQDLAARSEDFHQCQKLIEEAKLYNLLPDRRHQTASVRHRPRRSFGISEVVVAVGGGEDDKVVLRSVECFDPVNDKWLTLSCLPFAISKHGVVVTGQNILYVAGGEYPDGTASRSLWKYDPIFDQWQEMSAMNVERSELGSRACVVNNLIYVIGGWHASTENTNKVEYYDPVKNEWRFCKPMLERRYQPGVAVVDGKIYVSGGEEGWDRYHDTVEYYDPQTDQWLIAGVMQTARSWLCCGTLRLNVDFRIKEVS